MSIEPSELEEMALGLEQKASTLRAMAAELRAPRFKLVPEDARPAPAAKKSSEPGKGNLFVEVLGWFRAIWEATYGVPYVVQARDRPALGRLLNGKTGIPLSEVPELKVWFARYMTDGDPFLKRQGHGLALFCSQVNRYRAASSRGQQDELRPFGR